MQQGLLASSLSLSFFFFFPFCFVSLLFFPILLVFKITGCLFP